MYAAAYKFEAGSAYSVRSVFDIVISGSVVFICDFKKHIQQSIVVSLLVGKSGPPFAGAENVAFARHLLANATSMLAALRLLVM